MSLDIETITSRDRVSQAFFAAFIAALKGDDSTAGEILRSVADEILKQFNPLESKSRKKGRR